MAEFDRLSADQEVAIRGNSETLQLPNGRTMSYAQWGSPTGYPVIHFHGTPGSRMERYWNEAMLLDFGVRLITWDRPGYGFSNRCEGLIISSVANYVEALADHLGLAKFALHGMSGGAPFALATAYSLRERISAVAILAGLGPLDRPGALLGMSQSNMIEFTISRDHPAELEDFLANRSSRTPVLPETELAVFLRNPAMLQMMLENHHEMMRSGFAGIVSDDLALAAPWDFDIADILVPVYLWHGECDAIVPIHHAEHLAAGIPQSILHRCPNEGHFEMLCRQREVLASLLSFPRSPDNS